MTSVAKRSTEVFDGLRSTLGQHAHVGDIRGRGLFIGLEIVEDRETKKPFDASRKIAGNLKKAAFEAGLIFYTMAGTRDGKSGDHILLAPPFTMSEAQVSELVSKVETAVTTVLPT